MQQCNTQFLTGHIPKSQVGTRCLHSKSASFKTNVKPLAQSRSIRGDENPTLEIFRPRHCPGEGAEWTGNWKCMVSSYLMFKVELAIREVEAVGKMLADAAVMVNNVPSHDYVEKNLLVCIIDAGE